MKKAMVFLIKLYQKHISSGTARHCRFTPTCSQYAVEALEEWGAFRGLFLIIYRILRCNPLCKSGYDPVPLRKEKSK